MSLAGGWFSIENPWSSHFWLSTSFAGLCKSCEVKVVDVSQCAYGLRLPGASRNWFCHKRSAIASNLPAIQSLHRSCPGVSTQHIHDKARGSRSVNGKAISLAKAAGAYPREFCRTLARIVYAQLESDRLSLPRRVARDGNIARGKAS